MSEPPAAAERPPVRRDRSATRRRLLEAARTLFAEHGYEQVGVRMIAAEAGVNPALVSRYFGSKAELFATVLADEPTLEPELEGDTATIARRLAEHVAVRMQAESASPVLRALARSSANPEVRPLLATRIESALLEPLTRVVPGPDARGRATVVAAIIVGVGSLRRLIGPERPAPDTVDRLAAAFEVLLAPAAEGRPTE